MLNKYTILVVIALTLAGAGLLSASEEEVVRTGAPQSYDWSRVEQRFEVNNEERRPLDFMNAPPDASVHNRDLNRLEQEELDQLLHDVETGRITETEYALRKRDILLRAAGRRQ